ncbi:MAG: hypothetical protein WC865_01620 [Bacteroidales bacterium]
MEGDGWSVSKLTDGTETVVVSDRSWKWADGEITSSGIVHEDIDRRK